MTHVQNSAFKVKASTVPDVSKMLPEPGAMVVSEHDGRTYYADKYGWHRMGDPYSPINLFVDFDGTTQFAFKFQAPVASTLTMHDGDGTVTDVSGNDDTEVTHTTNYSEAGKYYFTVGGGVLDITTIQLGGMTFASGDIAGFGKLINLISLQFPGAGIYGDVTSLNTLVNLGTLQGANSKVSGDVSQLYTLPSINLLRFNNVNTITFDSVVNWVKSTDVWLNDCDFTATMVDNALKSFATLPLSGQIIKLEGNNAKRTARSDDAMDTLITSGNTVTVNE